MGMNGMNETYVGRTRRRRKEPREKPALANGRARLAPGPLDDAVVLGPEAELEHVALCDLDRVGAERETEPADGDRDGGRAGSECQHGQTDETGEHLMAKHRSSNLEYGQTGKICK